ncbi:MAG: outer membrane lipid asymmetry maintenance protein MlaD [Rhodospirillales bacterium]|nr:outer membrane lipid asymmetry maintenance protein MlaD [Rhodospirillales bacterium]
MSRNAIETIMGAVVLVIAALFLFFAYSTSQIRRSSGYEVTATFDRVDGIREGGDVRISGIKVGSIVSQTLDPKTFLAVVRMTIDPSVQLPTDTVAQIASAGLLGDKYLSLVPGGAEETIPPGGRIQYTQAAISLENLIGQYIFSSQPQQKDGQQSGPPAGLPSLEPKQ